MPESAAHARLVRAILEYIDGRFGSISNIAVRDDSSSPVRGERPPLIRGYVPDVYAMDVPTTVTVIGEAKTRHDLERPHSQAQISAFLNYLSATQGIFILSVPLNAGATARRIAKDCGRQLGAVSTKIVVLDELKATDITC
jgi:hypothetical protein